MRATPSGQRKKQLQKTANSEYEPFRQDFEWIVENLRVSVGHVLFFPDSSHR